MSKEEVYFAKKPPKECVDVLEHKVEMWESSVLVSGIADKIQRSNQYYHGSFREGSYGGDEHQILATGDQGEMMEISVNHYRNIGSHILNMVTTNRPSMQARAVNTDYKTLSQTILANGLLDYYMREKNLENVLKQATEYGVVLSEGWVRVEWDSTAGQIYGFNDETQNYIYEGDIKYTVFHPLNVVRDISLTDTEQHTWYILKTYKNKFDLVAQFPEYKDQILSTSSNDSSSIFTNPSSKDKGNNDLIPVYEFYHDRTDAMPDGRYMLYVNNEAVLIDTPLPYRFLPVFNIMPSQTLGTSFGYSMMFDLLPIQEAINMLYSTILTNQNAFGVQNVIIPKGADINLSQISGGLNIIEYNSGVGRPEALNLTQTPAEVFNFLSKLESVMETVSGVNSVARGNPEASLRTGTALALVQAQAVQFISGLQQSYVKLTENLGSATIKILQDFAKAPRVAAISGKTNKAYLKEFTGDDLSSINRVIVDIANPISKTTAGRLEMANNLIQYNIIDNIEQYFSVLNTGKLEQMTQGQQNELMLVSSENERLMEGENVQALAIDSHLMHITEHKSVLYDPDLRKDPNLVENATRHIQEHINMLRETDPQLLQLLKEQPLPPLNAPAMQEQVPGQEMPTQGAVNQAGESMEELSAPIPSGAEALQDANMPNLPKPPGQFANLPISPSDTLPEG